MSEFEKWQVYFAMRREQHDKADWYAASICDAIYRSQGAKTSRIEHHLLKFDTPFDKKQQPEDSQNIWLAWCAAMGGKVEA